MLEDKTKKSGDFRSLREYYNYLTTGKKIEDFGYNPLLSHAHEKNRKPIAAYNAYREQLLSAVHQRLVEEVRNKGQVDQLFNKQFFLNGEPLRYILKAPPESTESFVRGLRSFYEGVNKVAREKYGLQPITVRGEESCYLCKRTGRVIVVEEYNGKETLALCPHLYHRVMEESGINRRFQHKGFDEFIVEESNKAAVRAMRKYASYFETVLQTGESLLLIGPVGTGKTHLGMAVLMELIRRPLYLRFELLRKRYISLPQFLNEMRASFREERLHELAECEFLVVDDLGIETLDEWGRDKVFTLVNTRYQEKLPTIFISDLSPQELVNKLDERILSRLHEMARGVRIGGEDRRRKTDR
ncbi:MAG TPA: ATP-binding protein [Candidatus Mcinerneyibacteriales bacterium]|nr:ATP-binding protein [Candidatus Mcinerneyibacteriales bacterium]HPE20408.1 ATP-binding protein [Candidatus Mcinerneyibacteriales bacterium]HPJ70679.1 ATP-binding protein [Candidatus Mcinerneyibacteriales bacterium]HPQ89670.1 ATP-binding protein [Candidatus Mcinerneyibacteriales bacterium]